MECSDSSELPCFLLKCHWQYPSAIIVNQCYRIWVMAVISGDFWVRCNGEYWPILQIFCIICYVSATKRPVLQDFGSATNNIVGYTDFKFATCPFEHIKCEFHAININVMQKYMKHTMLQLLDKILLGKLIYVAGLSYLVG